MIFKGSRYTNTPLAYDDGVATFQRRDIVKFNLANCPTHVVVEGETLDLISYKYYNDPSYWWAILDANRSTISDFFAIDKGTKLKIPKYEEIKGVLRSE